MSWAAKVCPGVAAALDRANTLKACTQTRTDSPPLPRQRRRAPVAVLEQHGQHRRAGHKRARGEGQQAVRRLGRALGRHNEQRVPAAPRSARPTERGRCPKPGAPAASNTHEHGSQPTRQLPSPEQSSALDLVCLLFLQRRSSRCIPAGLCFAQTQQRAAAMLARAGLRNRPLSKEGIWHVFEGPFWAAPGVCGACVHQLGRAASAGIAAAQRHVARTAPPHKQEAQRLRRRGGLARIPTQQHQIAGTAARVAHQHGACHVMYM